jgi:CDP-glycerol glycerophosphotransferase (TagB/SpsB family)
MVKFADNNPDLQFILRPHHNLYDVLIRDEVMNSSQIALFEEQWLSLRNTFIDSSPCYIDSFVNSDALVTDGVSFLAEYQVTGKPIVFLEREDHKVFTPLGNRAAKGAYRVRTIEEAFEQINKCLVLKEDPMKDLRLEFDLEIRPYPNQASLRILNLIREGLRDEK